MRHLLLCALLALTGCDDGRADRDGGAGLDAASPPPDAAAGRDAAGTDGGDPSGDAGPPGADGGGGADAGPGAPPARYCVFGCSVAADCDTGSPAYDANNYRCVDGRYCEYTGCVDDAECQGTLGTGYGCRDLGGGLRTCVQLCGAAAECGTGTPAYDSDNYGCESGACVYRGCNDDAECEGTLGAAYGCFAFDPPPLPGIPVATRNCVRRCSTADDCGTDGGAYSSDNYACEGGACRYLGCTADMECQTSLGSRGVCG